MLQHYIRRSELVDPIAATLLDHASRRIDDQAKRMPAVGVSCRQPWTPNRIGLLPRS